MERQRCKVCSRTFANRRALGGHMKTHLSTPQSHCLYQLSVSSTSLSSSDDDDCCLKEKFGGTLVYELRENPKKSMKLSDHELSLTATGYVSSGVGAGGNCSHEALSSSVVQDRESETDEPRKPTKRRSKRTRKPSQKQDSSGFKKFKSIESSPRSPGNQEPMVSSVTDTSSKEDLAICLMMLSRDVNWVKRSGNRSKEDREEVEDCNSKNKVMIKKGNKIRKCNDSTNSTSRGKLRCEKCLKLFRSSQALGSHRRVCKLNVTELRTRTNEAAGNASEDMIFECPYCFRLFGSGQALGGHKRSHLVGSSTTTTTAIVNQTTTVVENSTKLVCAINSIDLNLPAPAEDDQFSVVSDT